MSGGVWLASYVVLWAAVGVLLVVMLALVRQIGVLHTRLDDVPGAEGHEGSEGSEASSRSAAASESERLAPAEGPPLGSRAPMPGRIGYDRSPLTLVAFTSASCELSQVLAPALGTVAKHYDDVRVVELPLGPRTIGAFEAFNVLHTPFVVAVGRDGRVRGRGRARNLQQLEMFIERALAVAAKAAAAAAADTADAPVPEPIVDLTSRSRESASLEKPDGADGDSPDAGEVIVEVEAGEGAPATAEGVEAASDGSDAAGDDSTPAADAAADPSEVDPARAGV